MKRFIFGLFAILLFVPTILGICFMLPSQSAQAPVLNGGGGGTPIFFGEKKKKTKIL